MASPPRTSSPINELDIRVVCFSDTNLDWRRYLFDVSESVAYLSMDPSSPLGEEEEKGYVCMVASKTGEHRTALDATHCRAPFSWIHSEVFQPLRGGEKR